MPDQSAVPNRTNASWIDSTAKLSATAVLAVYVAGFLIVAIHNASYGIVQHELVRPRLLATGMIFFVFLGIAGFAGSLTFRVFFFKENRILTDPQHFRYRSAGRLFDLLVSAVLSSFIVGVFFVPEPFPQSFRFTFLIIFAFIVPHIYLQHRYLQKAAVPVTVFAVVLFFVSFVALVKLSPRHLLLQIVWFFAIGLLAPAAKRSFENPGLLFEVFWGSVIGGTVFVVGFFTLFLYPHMRASLGGGSPVPVVLQFKEKSPLDPAQQRSFGWVLDESDTGFYLLKNDQDKDAIFVPRTDVTLVFYGDRERIKKLIKP